MSLVSYDCASDSDSECAENNVDTSNDEPASKKPKQSQLQNKLQLPQSILKSNNKLQNNEVEIDDPTKHNGRIRSFKHERGNWATFIYIPVKPTVLEDVQDIFQRCMSDIVTLELISDPHISVSKTVVLQYHLIDSFVKSLQQQLTTCKNFSVSLRDLKIYANEEKTRTFVAFKVEDYHIEKMYNLMTKVDNVMRDYNLPVFYTNPSFHISFLWCLGDKVDLLNANLEKLYGILTSVNDVEVYTLEINTLICKSGNKEFTFKLK